MRAQVGAYSGTGRKQMKRQDLKSRWVGKRRGTIRRDENAPLPGGLSCSVAINRVRRILNWGRCRHELGVYSGTDRKNKWSIATLGGWERSFGTWWVEGVGKATTRGLKTGLQATSNTCCPRCAESSEYSHQILYPYRWRQESEVNQQYFIGEIYDIFIMIFKSNYNLFSCLHVKAIQNKGTPGRLSVKRFQPLA